MDPSPIILDISSDEDFGWDDSGDDQFDWIAEFLDSVDKEKGESDEVVVVGEVSGRSASRKQNHQSLDGVKSGAKRVDVDDDDCLILDGDPDKPVAVDNGTGNESDELLIVGEKGQLACRDYPHPRHLCATFPFSATPHRKYCNMCHCYVCDSPAPCIHWGTGVSNTDHCHSNDKEEIWKVRRQCLKQGKPAAVPSRAPKQPETSLSMAVPQHNSGPAFTHSQPDSGSVYPHSRSNSLRPCSSASYSVPNIISQRSNQHSGFVPQRTRTTHHVKRSPLVPRSSSITNTVVQRGRSTLGAHCASSRVNFKRVGTPGISVTKNQSGHSSSFSNAHNYMSQVLQLRKNHHSQVKNYRTRNEVLFSGSDSQNTCQSSSQPSMGSSFVDFHPYTDLLQPQVYSQPDPVPNEDQSSYSQNTCQSSSQPSMGNNFAGCHPFTGSLQPQIYSHPNPEPNEDQNLCPLEEPHPDTTNLNLSDYGLSWLDDISQSVAPSTKSTSQPTQPMPEPPPDINPNPQYPCIDATSRELDLESWIDSLEAGAPKDAPYEFDCVPHQADLGDTQKSWLLLDIEDSFALPQDFFSQLPRDLRLDLNDAAFDLANGPVVDECGNELGEALLNLSRAWELADTSTSHSIACKLPSLTSSLRDDAKSAFGKRLVASGRRFQSMGQYGQGELQRISKAMIQTGRLLSSCPVNTTYEKTKTETRMLKFGELQVELTPEKANIGAAIGFIFAVLSWELSQGIQSIPESSLQYPNDNALLLAKSLRGALLTLGYSSTLLSAVASVGLILLGIQLKSKDQ